VCFIVKVYGQPVYNVTTAHVVKGNQLPDAYLFNRRRDPLRAEVRDRREDDVRGLALPRLKVLLSVASGVTALKLSSTSQPGWPSVSDGTPASSSRVTVSA
jgi:hypothetical protein